MHSQQTGHLAKKYCNLSLPLQVLNSAEGFYIGTFNEDGPISRESAEYFPTREGADQALTDGSWTQNRLEP